ncbi:MAG: H(+)/Cl(-) exchange transporter ClcA [Phycisphaerales bacterium]|nr:H(+)/Cl(-) exchange transporter ClcA [Phycisphaerales bacterium]
MIGVIAGLVAVAFKWALTESERARGALLDWLHSKPHSDLWGWAVLPLLGFSLGCMVGWMVRRFAPEAPGSGIPHLKGVLLHARTMRWKWLIPVKFLGGVLGIGCGLSLGREGPTVQMGAAVGQAMAELLRVPSRSVLQLVSCGAGAGIAAAFNAPLAGFLFVIEELHRELSARTFAGALVAALSADIVARALGGELPSFSIGGYQSIPLTALPVAVIIGLAGGVLGVCFNRSLLAASRASLRIPRVPRWALPGIAAALCGIVAWWFPDIVGGGHIAADKLLGGRLTAGLGLLVFMLVSKFLLTVVSYGSGAPGGIFAPMLLLGAIAGAILGNLLSRPFASLQHISTALAILGMAAFFTGSVRAPLTGIVLIIEMTGNYQQLLALGVTCLTADLTAGSLRDTPIYEALLEFDLRRRPPTTASESTIAAPRSVYIGVQRGSALAGKALRTSGMPIGCLVVSVERAGREILPEANLVLLAGDHLTILVPDGEGDKTMQVVRMATGI